MILAIIEVRLRQVQKHVDHQKFNVASITIYRQHSVTIKYKFLYIYYHMHQVWDTAIAVFQWNNDLYYFSVLFSDFLLVLLTTNFVIKWMIYWLYWLCQCTGIWVECLPSLAFWVLCSTEMTPLPDSGSHARRITSLGWLRNIFLSQASRFANRHMYL